MRTKRISPLLALACLLALGAVRDLVVWARARRTGVPPPAPPAALVPDVNTSPARHLLLLPRVGPWKAHAIVSERDRGGPFSGLDDLARVKGIGPKTVKGLEGRATAGDP